MVETSTLSGLRVDEILAEFFTRKLEEKDKLLKQSCKKSKVNDSDSAETDANVKQKKYRKLKKKKKHKKHKAKYKKERRHKSDGSENEGRNKKIKKNKHKSKKRRHSELPSENEAGEPYRKKLKSDKLISKNKNDRHHDKKESLQGAALDKLDSVLSEMAADHGFSKRKKGVVLSHLEENEEESLGEQSPVLPKSVCKESKIDKDITSDNTSLVIQNNDNIKNNKLNENLIETPMSSGVKSCASDSEKKQLVALPNLSSLERRENELSRKPESPENVLAPKLFTDKNPKSGEIGNEKKIQSPLETTYSSLSSCENLIKQKRKIIIKDLKSSPIVQALQGKEKCDTNVIDQSQTSSDPHITQKFSVKNTNKNEDAKAISVDSDSQVKTSETSPGKRKKKKSKHKHKRKKEKEKSSSRSLDREKKRKHDVKDRHSKSPSPKRQEIHETREKIDKARLLEIARKNLLIMIEKGTLPKGINVDALKQEQLVSLKSGGKSVQELTDFCRTLSQKEKENPDEVNLNKIQEDDPEQPFIHHPFKLRDPQPVIKLNIKNAVQLPIRSHAEKAADAARLRLQFPVSSGSQHRQKELEWIPVNKTDKDSDSSVKEPEPQPKPVKHVSTKSKSQKKEAPPVEEIITPPLPPEPEPVTVVPTIVPEVATIIPQPVSKQPEEYPNFPDQNSVDITSLVAQRLHAVQKLQENPNDLEALNHLYIAEQQIHLWAQSKQLPGQYTGSTDVRLLTAEELSGPTPVWVKKDAS